jgi:hypothetical protein
MSIATLLLLAAIAFAAPARSAFYLEGPAARTRTEAMAVVREANAEGWHARVVRRYRHGTGWEYVPLVEGFEEEESATEAARTLAVRTGRSMAVYGNGADEDGSSEAPEGDAPPKEPAPPEESERADDSGPGSETVAAMVDRAVRAHGGVEGGVAVLEDARRMLFRFRRVLPEGSTFDHIYARRESAVYVEVDLVEGEGTESRTWLDEESAWLVVEDGSPEAQDLERTAKALDRFSPERVAAFPLGFARATRSRAELRLLYQDGVVELDGVSCHLLRHEGDRSTGSVALALDPESFQVREVRFGSDVGEVIHRFSDYREVASGLVLPHRIRTWQGEALADDVEILELDLDPRLPGEWFRPPGDQAGR